MSDEIYNDVDPFETKEWIESIDSIISYSGIERAKFITKKILQHLQNNDVEDFDLQKNYVNTIPLKNEPKYPGDLDIEEKILSAIRWNAIVIVLKASKKNLDLGGHISTFQSIASIYDVCFNHFFRSSNKNDGGDLIYFQGHSSPGIYARAFLENRLSQEKIDNFRQEAEGSLGISSYPHPKLMPKFWQFPTVSMGLSAVCAIYQAKFLKYLKNRSLVDTNKQTVYAFLGDGEMDEPESKGAITIASRENLDNLIFVINCNLQRLDGPVFGNGRIIEELSGIFIGAGWKVIKVIWSSNWDKLFKKDKSGKLLQLLNETPDGDYQNFSTRDGKYMRENFFSKYPETYKLVEKMSDEEIFKLGKGGHDKKKIYAAFEKAKKTIGKPVVILFHTTKGYGLGKSAEGKNIAHQVKKISSEDLINLRKNLKLENFISSKEINSLPYIKFDKNSKEYQYMQERRKNLHGYIPKRSENSTINLDIPDIEYFSSIFKRSISITSTTMTFVNFLNALLQHRIKNHIVPIVADEARTFGMESLFRKIGIYNSNGQKYTPQDKEQFLYYREQKDGQILQEGINELGAASSWMAAATSYSTNNYPMIPFYIFYSMFGFQRIGDLLWAAGDQQARGFLIGGTSGRTTLNGEGLQHGDGHSHVYSLTVPNCISYDPSFSYELIIILQEGIKRMYGKNPENVYYYITVTNENYYMPKLINKKETIKGIKKGIYKFSSTSEKIKSEIQLLGSGSIFQKIQKASKILLEEYNIACDLYSVTSFTELARDGYDCERWNFLNFNKNKKIPYVKKILKNLPTVVATDYMKIFADQIRNFVPNKYFFVLGTDGFGRSDSRENLRMHFEVHENYIVVSALYLMMKCKKISKSTLINAMKKFSIDQKKINPRIS
ncbi:pyruvate dehydrogenase (acetyl-transferring), homodimeric type [bacterium endosymbiont of Pedicinus badii]|uniref:pyruvate dehydrogenase (acetyl-transferring), homodimeric type n=1 Tax=bacterium endosymbiont of Pedicinus badii TaxID=1719126 RepID=UPI0009B9AD7D|nr:pyruvate dehydrogenase (acetyl-transferring), homodimeric type [bacterium endosymbiont of Pedicinus badii]OQM34229.1 pyruvate dehydrogenase [bacterium endosymbiont of Pedicinus badii]